MNSLLHRYKARHASEKAFFMKTQYTAGIHPSLNDLNSFISSFFFLDIFFLTDLRIGKPSNRNSSPFLPENVIVETLILAKIGFNILLRLFEVNLRSSCIMY